MMRQYAHTDMTTKKVGITAVEMSLNQGYIEPIRVNAVVKPQIHKKKLKNPEN